MSSKQQMFRRDLQSHHRIPSESTDAEGFYWIKQKDGRTPLVVVLLDDERIEGTLEWYDRNCIKIRRADGHGLVVMKSFIKCIYKK